MILGQLRMGARQAKNAPLPYHQTVVIWHAMKYLDFVIVFERPQHPIHVEKFYVPTTTYKIKAVLWPRVTIFQNI